jgi:hypothetical protein
LPRLSQTRNDGSLPLYIDWVPSDDSLLVSGSRSYIMRCRVHYPKPLKSYKFRTCQSGNWRSAGKQKPASERQNNSVYQRSQPNQRGFTGCISVKKFQRSTVFCFPTFQPQGGRILVATFRGHHLVQFKPAVKVQKVGTLKWLSYILRN